VRHPQTIKSSAQADSTPSAESLQKIPQGKRRKDADCDVPYTDAEHRALDELVQARAQALQANRDRSEALARFALRSAHAELFGALLSPPQQAVLQITTGEDEAAFGHLLQICSAQNDGFRLDHDSLRATCPPVAQLQEGRRRDGEKAVYSWPCDVRNFRRALPAYLRRRPVVK